MEVPILKQGNYLIAPIQSSLSDSDFARLRDRLVAQVGKLRAKGVIIDLTALETIDSFATRMLRDTAHMIRLRGAETVIVGMQPEVTFAMVELGLSLSGVAAALDLEEGLIYLDSATGRRNPDAEAKDGRNGASRGA